MLRSKAVKGSLWSARCLTTSAPCRAATADIDLEYPSHPKPTPYEIFHLPRTASPEQIKKRYYDLVKLHHPDSPHCRHESDEVRQARFIAIGKAYDDLRGGKDSLLLEEVRRRGRRPQPSAYQGTRRSSFAYDGGGHEGYTDSSLFGIVTILAVVGSVALLYSPISPAGMANKRHLEARQALSEARREGREHGMERRAHIKKWVSDAGLEGVEPNIGKGGRGNA